MKKVLILTASYGHGHNTAAAHLKDYRISKWAQVEVLDLVEFAGIFGKGVQKVYMTANEKAPYLWEKTFDIFDSHFARDLMFSIRPIMYQTRFNEFLRKFKPDLVISTFPFWLWFLKKYFRVHPKAFKVGIVVTDAINIHQTWYLEEQRVDKRFVIDQFSRDAVLKKFKVSPEKVIVSFFPLPSQKFKNKTHISGKNILIMLSVAIDEDYIWELLELLSEREGVNILILRWRTQEFFDELKEEYQDASHISFYDFLPLVDEFGKKDRIYIGKPGGATMSEAIATDTPMIVPAYYPGQEEGNLKLLEMIETGFYVPDPTLTYTFIKYGDWDKLLPNFKKIKNPNSLEIIYKSLLEK